MYVYASVTVCVYLCIYVFLYIYSYLSFSFYIYIYICVCVCVCVCVYLSLFLCIYYHHHVVLLARISLTLSHHSSLFSITSGRSSRLHAVSIQRAVVDVLVSHPTLAHPCEGVHRKTSLVSSSLLLQQCPTCLVHLIWIVLEMEGRWLYSCCFVGCCFQDLFNIARSILVQFPSSFFSIYLISVYVVHPYNRIDMTLLGKNCILFY